MENQSKKGKSIKPDFLNEEGEIDSSVIKNRKRRKNRILTN
jgi:hypothetical protein